MGYHTEIMDLLELITGEKLDYYILDDRTFDGMVKFLKEERPNQLFTYIELDKIKILNFMVGCKLVIRQHPKNKHEKDNQ